MSPEYKTDWKVLQEIAERSPVGYRDQIRERNISALQVLERLYNSELRYIIETVRVGCPHCSANFPCETCIWSKALPLLGYLSFACCRVSFGVTYHNVSAGSNDFGITLNYCSIDIRKDLRTSPDLTYKGHEDYKLCKMFLEQHIEWTKRFNWGSKCKD